MNRKKKHGFEGTPNGDPTAIVIPKKNRGVRGERDLREREVWEHAVHECPVMQIAPTDGSAPWLGDLADGRHVDSGAFLNAHNNSQLQPIS